MIEQLSGKLAGFHITAATNPAISAFGKIEAIRINTEENFAQTENYIGIAISPGQYQRIKDYTHGILQQKASIFNQRVDLRKDSRTATGIYMPSTSALRTESVSSIALSLTTGSATAMWPRKLPF